MSRVDLLAFDADDTLWENERLYLEAQAEFARLLSRYCFPDSIGEALYQIETRNLEHFGYGVKAFALSMIEAALELTEGRISGQELQTLVDHAKGMLYAKVELLDGVLQTLELLKDEFTLMLLTKGDLFEQQNKIARSGLEGYFRHIEILSMKTGPVYRSTLEKYSVAPERFLMVGNSLKSDILPVLEIGGQAVYIPHELTWQHEQAEPPPVGTPAYYQLENFGRLPALLEQIDPDK